MVCGKFGRNAHKRQKDRLHIRLFLLLLTIPNLTEFEEGGYVIKVIPGNAHLKELRETAKEQLKSNQYSNAAVVDYFQKKYSVVYHKKFQQRIQ